MSSLLIVILVMKWIWLCFVEISAYTLLPTGQLMLKRHKKNRSNIQIKLTSKTWHDVFWMQIKCQTYWPVCTLKHFLCGVKLPFSPYYHWNLKWCYSLLIKSCLIFDIKWISVLLTPNFTQNYHYIKLFSYSFLKLIQYRIQYMHF